MKLGPAYVSRGSFIPSHSVQTLLVSCSDFRFQRAFDDFLQIAATGKADRLCLPGGHLQVWAGSAGNAEVSKNAIDWIQLLASKHHLAQIILCGHEGCAAYANLPKYKKYAEAKLRQIQLQDLLKAGKILKRQFPSISVKLYFAEPHRKRRDVKFFKVE